MILLYTKNLYLIHESHSPFHRKMYIRLLVWCHLRPIWPPVLPVNLTIFQYFFRHCPERTCPIHTSSIQSTNSHFHFLSLMSFIQGIRPDPRLLVIFRNKLIFFRWGVVSLTPKPQAGGPPFIGCPRLLIQYIRSYHPYLEGVSSIRNLRTRHAVVTRTHLTMPLSLLISCKFCFPILGFKYLPYLL
jgi:hypothetical protein